MMMHNSQDQDQTQDQTQDQEQPDGHQAMSHVPKDSSSSGSDVSDGGGDAASGSANGNRGSVDGSNLAMVEFYSQIGSCLTSSSPSANGGGGDGGDDGEVSTCDDGGGGSSGGSGTISWEGALLSMRDEYGKQAMAEVLRTVYGYGYAG
jgi:hypothetical protein